MTTDEFLHLALTDLREAVRSGIYLPYGACNAIRLYWYELLGGQCEIDLGTAIWRFRQLYMNWPKFSGDNQYPVPGGLVGSQEAYTCASHCIGEHWIGEYGKLRMEMIDFVIGQLEKELT